MKRWAVVVILLYAVILFVILASLAMLAVEGLPLEIAACVIPGWVVLMALCQAGLLVVPVRVESRRPVTKRHMLWPILVAAFSCFFLAAGMFLAVWETISNSEINSTEIGGYVFFGTWMTISLWFVWTFLFGFYTGGSEQTTFMRRTVRFLVAGSILELLVAVPAHVIARAKDYCCAGYLTVIGLGLGASVMLFAFGPGVFVLFIRRLRSIQPKQ